jgi:hypothetical protein
MHIFGDLAQQPIHEEREEIDNKRLPNTSQHTRIALRNCGWKKSRSVCVVLKKREQKCARFKISTM